MGSDFTKEVDKDNIAVITWNCLNKSMNTMTEDGLKSFQQFQNELTFGLEWKGMGSKSTLWRRADWFSTSEVSCKKAHAHLQMKR